MPRLKSEALFSGTELSTNVPSTTRVKVGRDKNSSKLAQQKKRGGSSLISHNNSELGSRLQEVGLQPSFYKQISARENSSLSSKEDIGTKLSLYQLAHPFPVNQTPQKKRKAKRNIQPSQVNSSNRENNYLLMGQ